MKIKHTDAETAFPWPEEIFIQGGGLYATPFIEVAPEGTFIRGNGETLAVAEESAWKQYQTWVNCDGSGEPHGPWEAHGYENGSGYCARCGSWGSEVLEPSAKHKANSKACEVVIERYGQDVVLHRSWRDLVEEETAIILNEMVGDSSMPLVRTVTPPTKEELEAIRKLGEEPMDLALLSEHLDALHASLQGLIDPASDTTDKES